MTKTKSTPLIGYSSGIAAKDKGCGDGPDFLRKSELIKELHEAGLAAHWHQFLRVNNLTALSATAEISLNLAQHTYELAKKDEFFVVVGGDHSSAIGTWSGVSVAHKDQGPIGLVWIDAHMDCHTPQTSESGNIHGMPLACLLGYGAKELTNILSSSPKVDPKHVALVGIRSYEQGEAELVRSLGIKVYEMDAIQEHGIEKILQDAISYVSQNTVGYGISLDLDGIDPLDAPGVGTPVPHGIRGEQLCEALQQVVAKHKKLLAAEIAEYNPHHDKNGQTQKMIRQLIFSMAV